MRIRTATLEELIALHEKGELVGAFNIPGAVYHAAPGLSKSGLDDVSECPALYKFRRQNPEEPSDEMELGSALHTAILEPDKFAAQYAIAGEELDRRGTKAWVAFEEAHPGQIILKFKAGKQIEAMVAAAHSHSRAGMLKGLVEISFFWKDPATGIQCKCRPDILTEKGVITDYKSAVNPWPSRVWSSVILKQRYHVQAAFYLDGVAHAVAQAKVLFPNEEIIPSEFPLPDAFAFYAQGKTEPYLVKPWLLGNASILLGRRAYEADLARVSECEKNGTWPGYPEALEEVNCPEYAWAEEIEGDDYGDE